MGGGEGGDREVSGHTPAVELAPMRTMAELDACVELQRAVWGYTEGDVLPRRIFVLANHIGGQVFGARVAGEIAGFLMALPGARDGVSYLHSHMLAVLPDIAIWVWDGG